MKENKIRIFGGLLAAIFVIMLPLVSLLGENDRAITVVQTYFDNIADRNFAGNNHLCSKAFRQGLQGSENIINYQFSLETALLEYFNIAPGQQYTVKAKRERTWVPYTGSDSLTLSIRAAAKEKSGSVLAALKGYLNLGGGEYLENFITLSRQDGRWQIDKINIASSKIEKFYQDSSGYLQETALFTAKDGKIFISSQEINLKDLPPLKKRILSFQLNKLLSLMNSENNQPK